MKLACLLSNGFEDLEAIGTIALLRRSGITCDIVSVFNKKEIVGSHQTKVIADVMMKKVNPKEYDGIFIPGGGHSYTLLETVEVIKLVSEFNDLGKWMFAICAAPAVFGVAGLLDGKKYTSFPTTEKYIPAGIRMKEKAVRDGRFITGRGAGAVYEFAFLIIETLLGKEKRREIEKRTQYVLE